MNIFVAKLNSKTTGESLKSLFEQYGEVSSSKVIMDRDTGSSKGYGFVEMPNDHEAMDAINELNETDFEGNNIVVKKARPKENAGGGGRGGFGGGRGNGGFGGGNRGGNGGGFGGGRNRY